MPCHHTLEAYLHAYLDGAAIADDLKGPLFRTIRGVGPEGRRVRVEFNGTEIGRFWTDRAFDKNVRVPRSIIPKRANILTFKHPDARRPSTIGASDNRDLAIRWRRLRVQPTTGLVEYSSSIRPLPRGPQLADLLIALYGDQAPSRLTEAFANEVDDQPGASMAYYIFNRIRFFDYSGVSKLLQLWSGYSHIVVLPSHEFSADGTLLRCEVAPSSRSLTFMLPKSLEARPETDSGARMLIWHWLSVIPLLVSYCQSERSAGAFVLNLGDEAHRRGISFCGRTSESVFIPDPYFLGSAGYQDLCNSTGLAATKPFSERLPIALWRGSSTVYRGSNGLQDLPRVRLCLLAKRPENSTWLDAGLTNFSQLQSA